MQERGYLEGAEMADTFNMLRSNDLIWSFVINNYLMGRDPFPFDLLHWNCDSTRMPAKMHSFYLRNMYLENKLKRTRRRYAGWCRDRLVEDRATVVFRLRDRRPYRTLESDLHRPAHLRWQVAFRPVGFRPYCRHDQSARREQIRLLDQRQASTKTRRVAQGSPPARRFMVAALGRLVEAVSGTTGRRTRGRQGRGQGPAQGDRTRTRQLREAPRRRPLAARARSEGPRALRGDRAWRVDAGGRREVLSARWRSRRPRLGAGSATAILRPARPPRQARQRVRIGLGPTTAERRYRAPASRVAAGRSAPRLEAPP